jgi:hypothetical protein
MNLCTPYARTGYKSEQRERAILPMAAALRYPQKETDF